jgi:hypothetical protein
MFRRTHLNRAGEVVQAVGEDRALFTRFKLAPEPSWLPRSGVRWRSDRAVRGLTNACGNRLSDHN